DAGLLEFQPEIVALAGSLADARENRYSTVLGSEVADEFLNDNCFADARTTEESDFSAAQKRFQQIDDLDAGLGHLEFRGLLFEGRRLAMNRVALIGGDRAHLVHWLADDVQHAAERLLANRNANRLAEVDGLHSADQAVGGL